MSVIAGRTPVIVGVGQVNISRPMAPEPVELLATAARIAAEDAGSDSILRAVESIRIVKILSRRYPDPAALVASRIGATPRHRATTTDGGNHPQALINRTASEITRGELDVALIGGAESWRTRSAYKRSGDRAHWSHQDPCARPTEIYGIDKDFFHAAEVAIGLTRPTKIYPLFESALRAKLGRDITEHGARIADLCSRFSRVAVNNPYAALPRAYSAEQIAAPSDANRMICHPYPKLMNSNNAVDQASALIICSVRKARELRVSEDRWVYPVSGADANDADTVSTRHDLASSPAIRVAGRTALKLAGVGIDDIEYVDLYSCFPSAVQVAALELGLSLDRQLTLTGGLTFAGGPWHNYSTHAIATLVPLLRARPDAFGLITANGGLLTKHSIGVYSGRPPRSGFHASNAQAEVKTFPTRSIAVDFHGPAVVESYTVEHNRDGVPTRVLLSALTRDGHRTWHTKVDDDTISAALSGKLSGTNIEV